MINAESDPRRPRTMKGMKTRKREIARAGIFGSKDAPQIVTEKDLREIAETFPEIKKAPVSLNGHWPRASSPRLGNVTGVFYDEATQTLTGEIEEDDALAEAVDSGYYPDVSIGARQRASDGKMYLHHLAYLGEEPPAIKDLAKEIKTGLGIAAGDKFSGRILPAPSAKRLYLSENPPENLLEGDGPRANNVKESAPQSGAGSGADSAKTAGTPGATKEATVTEEEARELREKNERLEAENKRLQEEKNLALSDSEKQKKESERARLKAAMESRKVPQGVREKALRLCDALDGGRTVELSDAEAPEGKRSVSAADCLIELASSFTPPVTEGAMNLSDGDAAAGDSARIKLSQI